MIMKWDRPSVIIALVFCLGLFEIAFVLSFVNDEVFFSGDGGIKALMIKQYADNGWNAAFHLNASKATVTLWDQGLYPFREPFVYRVDNGWMSAFPPYFSLLNTPLYMAFGYKGLYVIPALSLIAVWGLFVRLSQQLKLEFKQLLMGLAFLIFGSSLTIYAGIFWEHTLATLCSFIGLYFIITNQIHDTQTAMLACVCGMLAGLSLWLRPEALFMLLAYGFWAIRETYRGRVKPRYFLLGLGLIVMGFFLANYILLGEVTGIHSRQITEGFDAIQRVKKALYIFAVLCAKAALFDPIWVLILPLGGFYLYKSRQQLYPFYNGDLRGILLLLGCFVAFYYVTIIWILPNSGGLNWGIRYSLIATPIGPLLAMILYQESKNWKHRFPLTPIILILLVAGLYQNIIRANDFVYSNYNGDKLTAIKYLREHPKAMLLMSNQNLSAEYQALMPSTEFLLTDVDSKYDLFMKSTLPLDKDYALLYEMPDGRALETLTNRTLEHFSPEKSFGRLVLMKPEH